MGAASRLAGLLRELARAAYGLTIGIFKAVHEQGVEALQLQEAELNNAFLSLVLGGMVGLPLAPIGLAAELLPLLKDEVRVMETRHFLGADVLADYFSSMGGEW